jgi:2-amino-4-hydroxy-6-hydroxymethyldihydropteridine diphosphokinase
MDLHSEPRRPPGDGAFVALGLGSNVGDRRRWLERAAAWLTATGAVEITGRSRFYETEPVEAAPQPWYLNQVLSLRTRLSPDALLALAQRAEESLGRRRNGHHGPRTLDVDLLCYGSCVRWTPRLRLPHPALSRRRCLLVPLAELGATWRHPVLRLTPAELLAVCFDPGRVFPLRDRLSPCPSTTAAACTPGACLPERNKEKRVPSPPGPVRGR